MTGSSLPDNVLVQTGVTTLPGRLHLPGVAHGLIVLAEGGGWSRPAERQTLAATLHARGFGTLLVELMNGAELHTNAYSGAARFDIEALTRRLLGVVDWVRSAPATQHLRIGLCGSSAAAAAALCAVAERPGAVDAVVSHAGRPDLAGAALQRVITPTLLIVGEHDAALLKLSRIALRSLRGPRAVRLVPGAAHREDTSTSAHVARLARAWFQRHVRP